MKEVQLPTGMPPGQVIGLGGCIAKRLTALTRVRFRVVGTDQLQLRGPRHELSWAHELLQELFEDFLAEGDFGERCQVLSADAFPDGKDVQFVPRKDEASLYLGKRGLHFVLVPAALAEPRSAAELVADALASADLDAHPTADDLGVQTMFSASAAPTLVGRLAAAAAAAAGHSLGFDELKLRLNFGKMFFYKIKGRVSPFSQQAMQDLVHGKGFGCSFSNCVPGTAAERLQDVLTGRGFQQVDRKHSLTVHVEDQQSLSSRQYSLSLQRNDDTSPSDELTVRKIKTSSRKVFTLCSLGHGLRELDCRLKLIAQNHFDQDTPLGSRLRALGQLCRVAASEGGWTLLPLEAHLQRLGLSLRASRFKSKSVFQGSMAAPGQPNITLRLSILTVQSICCDGVPRDVTATEVTGACVQLSAALEALRCSSNAERPLHQSHVEALTSQLREAMQDLTRTVAGTTS